MKKDKKELDWFDKFKKEPHALTVIRRLGFTQKHLPQYTNHVELEDFRMQYVNAIEHARREWEKDSQKYYSGRRMAMSRYYLGGGGQGYSMFRDFRRAIRYRHSQSFEVNSLYRAKSNIYGDIKLAGWGIGGYRKIEKNALLTNVGYTEDKLPLFMVISGKNSNQDFIRVSGVQLDKIVKVGRVNQDD